MNLMGWYIPFNFEVCCKTFYSIHHSTLSVILRWLFLILPLFTIPFSGAGLVILLTLFTYSVRFSKYYVPLGFNILSLKIKLVHPRVSVQFWFNIMRIHIYINFPKGGSVLPPISLPAGEMANKLRNHETKLSPPLRYKWVQFQPVELWS